MPIRRRRVSTSIRMTNCLSKHVNNSVAVHCCDVTLWCACVCAVQTRVYVRYRYIGRYVIYEYNNTRDLVAEIKEPFRFSGHVWLLGRASSANSARSLLVLHYRSVCMRACVCTRACDYDNKMHTLMNISRKTSVRRDGASVPTSVCAFRYFYVI